MTRLLLLCLAPWACGHPWTVVRQASPNPVQGVRDLGLEAVGYDALRVGSGSEATYLSGRDAAAVSLWHEGKAALESAFRSGLAASLRGHPLLQPGGPRWTLRPNVTLVDPAVASGEDRGATRVDLTLTIVDSRSDEAADEVTFSCVEAPGETGGLMVSRVPTGESVGVRLRTCGRRLGEQVAEYVTERTGVE